jgi:hypothetical protein
MNILIWLGAIVLDVLVWIVADRWLNNRELTWREATPPFWAGTIAAFITLKLWPWP